MTDHQGDYVLGTGDVEIARLGLQHRVWRPHALRAWERAGITEGARVLDLGAGPGFATADLAENVGPSGEVIAIERSERFVQHARALCQQRGLRNVRLLQQDVMEEPLPELEVDAAWCRWVACFVSTPQSLVQSIARALRPGGRIVFHEYGDYASWRFAPRRLLLEQFVAEVMSSWRVTGGEPDIGLELPTLLRDAGMQVERVEPIVFTVHPHEYTWRWPAAFIRSGLDRLVELGRIDGEWAERALRELAEAESDPSTIMITPLVLEIVARR
jgi:SAM-dependent methyltransferase